MAFHLTAADRREGSPDTGENNPQIIIYFRGCGDSRARIPDIDFLLNSDRWRNPFNGLHIRLAHPAEELSGVRAEAFGETPLPFSEQCVESQGRLSGTGYAGHDHELVPWYLDSDVLEVVDLRTSYYNLATVRHIQILAINSLNREIILVAAASA